jgi:hypothetical protein
VRMGWLASTSRSRARTAPVAALDSQPFAPRTSCGKEKGLPHLCDLLVDRGSRGSQAILFVQYFILFT